MAKPKRTLELDLSALARIVVSRTDLSEVDRIVAQRAYGLLVCLYRSSDYLTAKRLAEIPEDVWTAAHMIADGGLHSPYLRAAAEALNEDAYTSMVHRITNLPASLEPRIEPEFI